MVDKEEKVQPQTEEKEEVKGSDPRIIGDEAKEEEPVD
jgi:hypothetical protein